MPSKRDFKLLSPKEQQRFKQLRKQNKRAALQHFNDAVLSHKLIISNANLFTQRDRRDLEQIIEKNPALALSAIRKKTEAKETELKGIKQTRKAIKTGGKILRTGAQVGIGLLFPQASTMGALTGKVGTIAFKAGLKQAGKSILGAGAAAGTIRAGEQALLGDEILTPSLQTAAGFSLSEAAGITTVGLAGDTFRAIAPDILNVVYGLEKPLGKKLVNKGIRKSIGGSISGETQAKGMHQRMKRFTERLETNISKARRAHGAKHGRIINKLSDSAGPEAVDLGPSIAAARESIENARGARGADIEFGFSPPERQKVQLKINELKLNLEGFLEKKNLKGLALRKNANKIAQAKNDIKLLQNHLDNKGFETLIPILEEMEKSPKTSILQTVQFRQLIDQKRKDFVRLQINDTAEDAFLSSLRTSIKEQLPTRARMADKGMTDLIDDYEAVQGMFRLKGRGVSAKALTEAISAGHPKAIALQNLERRVMANSRVLDKMDNEILSEFFRQNTRKLPLGPILIGGAIVGAADSLGDQAARQGQTALQGAAGSVPLIVAATSPKLGGLALRGAEATQESASFLKLRNLAAGLLGAATETDRTLDIELLERAEINRNR